MFVELVMTCFLVQPGAAAEPTADEAPAASSALKEILAGKTEIADLPLDDFLTTVTEVAAMKSQTLRDAPAVLTVVTREEIATMGARDLLDILVMVPGFVPAQDSSGSISVGFRGLWSNDGRQLVLVDGQEINEPFYTNVRMNNRFPVDQIERIEIIRGPGSAIYGGYAELAVINIITRNADHQNGASMTSTFGVFDADRGRRTTMSVSYAKKLDALGGLKTSAALFAGRANGSGNLYTDMLGERYRMTHDNNLQEPLFANVGLAAKGLELRFIYDGFQQTLRDNLNGSSPPHQLDDIGYFAEARYVWKIADGMTLTPRFNFKRQEPWRVSATNAPDYYMKTADRYLGNVTFSWDVLPELNLLAGAEGYVEAARLDRPDRCGVSFQCSFLNGDTVSYKNAAGFAQLLISKAPFGSLTAGARIEDHSTAGVSFVPRAAYTFVLGDLHAKLMASQAFRAPGIENINTAPTDDAGHIIQTKPEKTTTFEAEVGYRLSDILWVTANAFDLTIKDPISYFVSGNGSEGYLNYDETGTRGVELEARLRGRRGWATFSYSYYRAGSALATNTVPQYAVPVADQVDPALAVTDPAGYRQDVLLGWPQHKLTALGAIEVLDNVWLSASTFFMSERWAYDGAVLDPTSGAVLYEHIKKEKPQVVTSLFATKRDLGLGGLNLIVGVHNVFDQRFRYVQGYAGGHAPSPAPSREYFLRVVWDEAPSD